MNRRGMTLVELLLSMSLSLLLAGVMLSILKVGRTFFLTSLDEMALADCSYRVPREIVDHLIASQAESVTPGNSTFSFMTAYDSNFHFCTQADGTPLWQGRESYHLEADRLYRNHRVLARHVSAIRLVDAKNGSFQLTMDLDFQGYKRKVQREVKLWARPVN